MRCRVALVAVVAAVLASACGGSDRGWGDMPDPPLPLVDNATELAVDDDYRLLLGDDPSADAADGGRCIQLVVGDVGAWCAPVDPAEPAEGIGRTTQTFRGPDDERIVWFRTGSRDGSEAAIDHFVVWSSADPDGRRIEPVREGSALHLVWSMEPGEAPWGMQMIASDGSLLFTDSLVGLSGD